MRTLLFTCICILWFSYGISPVKAAGNLYICNALEIQSLSPSGKLEETDYDNRLLQRLGDVTFDEASGILRDGIGTYEMQIVQQGTSENSTIAIDTYQGAVAAGSDVFRIATWEENMPFLYLRSSTVYTGTCKRMN